MGRNKTEYGQQNRAGIGHSFLKLFFITFCIVVAAGVSGMIVYRWVMEPAKASDSSHFQLNREIIVRGSEAGKQTQIEGQIEEIEEIGEQIDEIITVNDKYADILNDPDYMMENNIYAKDAADAEQVTITFAGDILFDEHYAVMARVTQKGGDITYGIDSDLISEMKSADIMMLNNEFPYSDKGEPLEDKQFTFRARPSAAAYLEELGVDIVSLANNHAYDFGEAAFLDTLEILENEDIACVGAGRNLSEARKPVCYIINNIKIAIISATQIERLDNPDTKGATDSSAGVFRCWNGANLLETVREARENNDYVIVYLHWGTENVTELDWTQEKQAAEVAEAGADLIIGAHPHCLQQISVVKGVPVVYSLGNFWFNSKTLDTGMFKVTLNENGLQSCQFIPCLQSGSRTVLLQGEEKQRVLDFMQDISEDVQIDEDGYVTW